MSKNGSGPSGRRCRLETWCRPPPPIDAAWLTWTPPNTFRFCTANCAYMLGLEEGSEEDEASSPYIGQEEFEKMAASKEFTTNAG